jgi:hypothetical protein
VPAAASGQGKTLVTVSFLHFYGPSNPIVAAQFFAHRLASHVHFGGQKSVAHLARLN